MKRKRNKGFSYRKMLGTLRPELLAALEGKQGVFTPSINNRTEAARVAADRQSNTGGKR